MLDASAPPSTSRLMAELKQSSRNYFFKVCKTTTSQWLPRQWNILRQKTLPLQVIEKGKSKTCERALVYPSCNVQTVQVLRRRFMILDCFAWSDLSSRACAQKMKSSDHSNTLNDHVFPPTDFFLSWWHMLIPRWEGQDLLGWNYETVPLALLDIFFVEEKKKYYQIDPNYMFHHDVT